MRKQNTFGVKKHGLWKNQQPCTSVKGVGSLVDDEVYFDKGMSKCTYPENITC